jgi:hypothetical protein
MTTQSRDATTGVYLATRRTRRPNAPLLEMLQFIARGSVRRVYNDPLVTVHVERCCLRWLLDWDPVEDQPVRQYIGLKAGNEARRLKAMSPRERSIAMGRSWDYPVLVSRVKDGQDGQS